MAMQKFVKTWALPDRTQERRQLTLRLNFDSYARLHALKEVYPNRTVNEMINDILATGLDEIVEALPKYRVTDPAELFEVADHQGCRPEDLGEVFSGPAISFDIEYKKILDSKSDENPQGEAA